MGLFRGESYKNEFHRVKPYQIYIDQKGAVAFERAVTGEKF
jgi:hypothetical protein